MSKQWIIGVDEAGRGPLAGPVAVGSVIVRVGFDWTEVPGVADSKKLTEARREAVYERALALRRAGGIDFQVALVGAQVIDEIGIVGAVQRGMARTLGSLMRRSGCACDDVSVKLDGALRAPLRFEDQETIIGGDGSEQVIGLASILAKVTRDRYMVRLGAQYPSYGFEIHKGYGTRMHREAVMTCGLSDMHRRSFCKMLLS